MRKKELEKLELDIAREKDLEVANRLKAVLEARKGERRERSLQLKRCWGALRRVVRIALIVTFIVVVVGIVGIIVLAWLVGVTGNSSR